FAAEVEGGEEVDFAKPIAAIAGADPPDAGFPALLVNHDVRAVDRVEQSVRADFHPGADLGLVRGLGFFRFGPRRGLVDSYFREVDRQVLDLRAGARADCRRCDSIKSAILIACNQAALWVD